MGCQVTYNKDGSIKKVLDANGNESKLFLDIAKSPLVNTLEEALDIYKQSYKLNPPTIEEVDVEDNKSADTQDFFSDVVTGKSDKYKPKKPWSPSLVFTTLENKFKSIYEKFKGLFDEHIATSIPTFRETQVKVGSAIRQMLSPQPRGTTEELLAVKAKFVKDTGMPLVEPKYSRIDKELFREMAEYHKNATDDRQNPQMLESYRAFFEETRAQYDALVAAGYKIEPWMGEGEPYGVDSDAVRKDVLENKHLYYLRSKSATGENNEGELTAENYIPFESSGITINGDDVLLNDLFRAVHDIFGHVMVHNTFSPQGEYNAYKTHATMYSEKAQKALFMETVVDNAWYYVDDTYAPRKIYDIPQRFMDKVHEDMLVYDIGGSEGGFVKAITESSKGAIESINLDPNPDMKEVHEASPVKGSEFVQEAFYESFEDKGVTYKKHVPERKADVVHESMVFQFITPKRAAFIKEIKDNYLKEDGIFLTEEKLIPSSEDQWRLNELKKNEYKSQYYTQEQLQQKTEEVLVGMKKNQTMEEEYVRELKKSFKYVQPYWSAGNFKGYIATDSKQKLDEFMKRLGGEIQYSGTPTLMAANNSSNYANMTEDGQGNFVFYHSSSLDIEEIDPSKYGSNPSRLTSREEARAMSLVGGMSMYYTRPEDGEIGTGNNKYMVKVRKDKVYDFNLDSDGLLSEAEEVFRREHPNLAFTPNVQVAYVAKLAAEYGYEMVVARWTNGRSRAQTTSKLKPVDKQAAIGNTLVNVFENNYVSNSKKGYIPVVPQTKQQKLRELYSKDIYKARNDIGLYDELYHLYANYSKYTQEEISDLIENSDLSDEIKAKYVEIVTAPEGQAHSKLANPPEPRLEYESAGRRFTSYRDALETGEDINAGIETADGFKTLFTVPYNINPDTKLGLINLHIKEGLLSEEKVLYRGKPLFKPAGYNYLDTRNNLEIIESDLQANLGRASYDISDGHIDLNPDSGDVFYSYDTNEQKIVKDLVKEIIHAESLTLANSGAPNKISEDELRLKLLTFLNKIGISTMSIADYVKKYGDKNGVNLSATALADIANRIIAFKDGVIGLDALTEEVMHMIVEMLPEESTANILRNIHKTTEYAEHAANYREIYKKANPNMSEQEIEALVRKEVLGKVLKNSTLDNLNPKQRNFFQKALDLIREFFSRITSNDTLKSDLEKLNRQIEELFVQENLSDYLDNKVVSNKPFVMYQINSAGRTNQNLDLLRAINKSLLTSLKQGYMSIKKGGGALYADKVRLQQYEDKIDEVSQASAATDFLALINRMTDYVGRAVRSAQNNGSPLTIEEQQVLVNLKGGVRSLLEAQKQETINKTPAQLGLAEGTSNAEAKKRKDSLVAQIDEAIRAISDVSGQATNLESNVFEAIAERIKRRHNLGDEYTDFILSQSKTMVKEINYFMETFGQLTHSSDALLNMAGQVIEEMWGKHASRVQKRFRAFTKVMEENGVTPEQMSELFDNGFLTSVHDFAKFEEKVNEVNAEVYNEIMGENLSTEAYLAAKEDGSLKPFSGEQELAATALKSSKMSEFEERRMNNDYYEKQTKKYQDLGISKFTINQLKALSLQRAIIQNNATDEDGNVIYTEDNKAELDSLSQMRKEYKSLVDSLGVLKNGIKERTREEAIADGVDLDDKRVVEVGGLIYTLEEGASNDATMAMELYMIDKDYEENSKQTNTIAFLDKFVSISDSEGIEAGLEFLKNNMGISFSTEFWNGMSSESILDNPEINAIPENRETIKKIRQKRNALSNLKRLYQDPKNPQEIKGYEMRPEEQKVIRELVEQIDLEMSNLIRPEGFETESWNENDVERSVNQSYKVALEKEGIDPLTREEYGYIKQHVTDSKKRELNKLENQAMALDQGRSFVSAKTIERLDEVREPNETYYEAFVKIARGYMLPYYRRFTPAGYKTIDDLVDNLTEDEAKKGSVFRYINDLQNDPNYEINIHYTFNVEDENINPNWDKDFEGGYHQPRLDKFLSKKFVDLFDPVIENGKVVSVRKNQNLYKAREALLEVQRQNLKDVGLHRTHNLFLAPQISRTGLNKTYDALQKENKTDTLKEALKDTFKYRIDDLEYGDRENQTDIQIATDARTVPTFYTRRLENPNDVSDDLFYSYLAMTNQSVLHKARREGLVDIMAVEDKMVNRSTPRGKAAESTRNYKMLKSAIDYNFFGKQETRAYKVKLPIIDKEVDLTKVLRLLHKYVKLRNLGLNVIVPFTSYITGEVQLQIEATLGEYLSRDSVRLASKEFAKLFKEAASSKNSLSYNDKSRLNIIGEEFGVYQQIEKAGDAKYSTVMRWLPRAGMVLHKVGNFPIIPRIFLAILHDHRVVNGKLISRKDFIKSYRADGKTEKQAKSDWREYESKTLYNYLDVTEEGVKYKPQLLEELGNDQDYLDEKLQRIKSLIKDQIQKIDGQIPESQRVQAQRDAIFNYFMTHRGWFSIGAQRRLKSIQFNVETGQLEEGSYITLKNLMYDFFGELGGKGDKTWNFIKAFKSAYKGRGRGLKNLGLDVNEETSELERDLIARNMKRVGVEFAFMTGIVLMLAALNAMADDDENKDIYALQLTNYFMWRLANETSSTQLGLFNETANIVKEPVVAYQQIIDMFKIGQIFDTDTIKRGTYRGHTGTYKYFFKNTVGLKGLHDLMNIRNTKNTYDYYNRGNINFTSMGLFSMLGIE